LSRVVVAVALVALVVGVDAQQNDAADAERLRAVLGLRPGSVVADIGAGDGALARRIVSFVLPGGRVFASELGDDRVAQLRRKLATPAGAFEVIESGTDGTNLPDRCCDAIYMRHVYHHIGDPQAFAPTVERALRAGGRLAVVDFAPQSLPTAPAGSRANGEKHGVEPHVVIRELEEAGFRNVSEMPWPSEGYFLVIAELSR